MRRNPGKRMLAVWACASIALMSGSAALAELPRHLLLQTLEPTPQEVFPHGQVEGPQSVLFGHAVAMRNGTAFVGMPGAFDRHGRVVIFKQTENGGWQRAGTLDPSDDFSFGQSLAFRDGYLIVGASKAVYVFRLGGGHWNLWQRLARPTELDADANSPGPMHFESGILVIGAPSDRLGPRAYVYDLNAAGKFVLRSALKASDARDGELFGTSVSVASGVIVIGAPGDRGLSSNATGAAYVFRRNSSGAWVQRQRLVATETQARDRFGAAVAIDKGMIVVGAPQVDVEGGEFGEFGTPTSDGHIAGGAAYGFVPVGGLFVETFKLRPRPDENFRYTEFGRQIEMFDKRIVVAALDPQLIRESGGYVHTYARDGSIVTPVGLAGTGLAAGFLATSSLALANQWLLVGSELTLECAGTAPCIGEANVFDLSRFTQ
jgi:hypothetical protein